MLSRLVISGFIIVIVAMQASTCITGTRVWPFMAYCMYSNSVRDSVIRTDRVTVFGILEGGREYEITPDLVGLSFFGFLKLYVRKLQTGNAESASELRDRVQDRLGEPLQSLRVQTEDFILTSGRLWRELRSQTFPFE